MDEEKEARAMGWVPREEWKGDQSHWVDAPAFLERGRQVLPILSANNRKLVEQLTTTSAEVAALRETVKAQEATVRALEESREEDVKAEVEAMRKELKEKLAAASREGDHDAIAELTEQLTELKVAARDAELDEEEAKPAKPAELPQEIKDWYSRNPEYVKNPRRMALAQAIAFEMRQGGEQATGAVFLDKVAEEVEKTLGGEASGHSKVSGGNGGGGRRSGGEASGKSYEDLPSEAKAACDKMEARLVGPNRAHKTVESWRKSYVKQFFQSEA